jgi:hypothetical protein
MNEHVLALGSVEATVDTPWMEPPASRNNGLRLRTVWESGGKFAASGPLAFPA